MDEAIEEAIEDNTQNTSELDNIESLCFMLKTNPQNKDIRLQLENEIKKLYIKNGGLPINTQNPIPTDLKTKTNDELEHIVDNMMMHLNRSNKEDIVSKCLNIITNVGLATASFTGLNVPSNIYDLVNADAVLKQSIVAVFLGKGINPNPQIVFAISALSHASNFVSNFFSNGQQRIQQQPSTEEGDSRPEDNRKNYSRTSSSST